jgi:hypothetical protein
MNQTTRDILAAALAVLITVRVASSWLTTLIARAVRLIR